MAYYTKVLQADEVVRYQGRLHWIVYRKAISLCIFATVATTVGIVILNRGQIANDDDQSILWFVASMCLFLIAFISFLPAWFKRVTTEIIVTDKRIIHKSGWISLQTEEMNLSKVETVDVNQAMLGRVLGFGTILLRGTGSSWEPLGGVATPIALRKAIVAG
jgi:uncharacterized membrane protein YdbT with pleckstrin-like domain